MPANNNSNKNGVIFGSPEVAERLRAQFGDQLRTHAIPRRNNKDVPEYLKRLREAQRKSESSKLCFG